MSSRVCSQCGCSDIDIDSARGDVVCTGCGSVLEDQIIVSEIQFAEGAGGVSSMVGQFVSTDGPKSLSMGGTFRGGMQKESRTITLQNGKKKIQQLAGQMKLNQMCVDRAFNFFKMAVSRRITRGRKTTHVTAACLYLVCRTERTPHMLLDFSDQLQVNVFVLGRTYLCLAKELCINMPEIDPCLYIPRFAHALEFGEKTHEVSMTAMRLVQRMKRDWMHTGRRPSGLCGAALLVAARIHDYSRTVREVIRVVKVCQSTLRKRLSEFEDTPSSQLTIEEFQTIDLEEEADPPSFTEGKRKLAKAKLEPSEKQLEEISRLQEEIETTLQNQKPRGIWAAYAKMADDSVSVDSDVSRFSDLTEPEASNDSSKTASSGAISLDTRIKLESYLQQSESRRTKNENLTEITLNDSITSEADTVLDDRTKVLNEESESPSESTGIQPTDNGLDRTTDISAIDQTEAANKKALDNFSTVDQAGVADNKTLDNFSAIERELVVGSEDSSLGSLKLPVSVPAVDLGVDDIVGKLLKEGSENSNDGQNTDEELDLEGLDDTELDKFILTEKEVQAKTKIWMAENADYLQAQKEKEERLAREKEEEEKKPPEKKRRTYKKRPRIQYQEGQSAQEAIQKIMQEKRISSKINYDVLNDLTASSVKSSSTAMAFTPEIGAEPVVETDPVKRPRKAGSTKEGPAEKKMKLPLMLPETEATTKEEVVVESGPVQYLQKDEVYDEDEEEAEEYYEDDVTHLSAAQLLGHTGAEEEDDYEEML